jgi:dihydrofolate reductase
MKVILYMAVSADGFIAKPDGDSDWVSEIDNKIFVEKIKQVGCIIIGRKTFEQFYGELYPQKDALNIVVSNNKNKGETNTVFAQTPKAALLIAKEKHFSSVLLIGGGTVNGSFLKENLIDEIYFDVHPLILGGGIKVFEGFLGDTKINLLDSKLCDGGQVMLHYNVNK